MPVIVDGAKVVVDSRTIATYLESAYPATPSLFGGEAAQSMTRFMNLWTDKVVQPALAALILTDIYAHIDEKDRAYFRSSREKAFGKPPEAVSADRDSKVVGFRSLLEPLRGLLQLQPYVAGNVPAYADYIAFQWARSVSPFR